MKYFAYQVLNSVLAELLPGDNSQVAVGIPKLLVTQETFLFESADYGGDGVVMWFGFGKFVYDLLDVGRAFLPEELHDLLFAVGKMFHLFIICLLMSKWNTHIIIFGWGEHFLMGISCVTLIFNKHNYLF